MEIEGQEEYDAKIQLRKGHDKAVFGRGLGLSTDDRTVSRRHVAFELKSGAKQTEPIGVSFEVLGKNPVWVWSKDDGEIRVFRRSEKGELATGDWFCVSGKKPAWFVLRDIGVEEGTERLSEDDGIEWAAENSRSGLELEGFDVSDIDPVKEFGFVVMGHEFDHYPKLMIRDVQKWDWFLEEDVKESEDEEKFEKKKKRGVSKRRKRGKDNENDDDEEWTGESEDDKELVRKANNRSKYSTRSKDRDKPQKDNSQDSKKSSQKKVYIAADDEEDEMLGGFVVGDEDVGHEEEMNGDDEEEEEFVDDDDDE
ncbi:hypothetical protein L484_005115 [Morus notabilis]|uniref:FHA domain-containing protein n=1 Tax=Morus notabilis TaxID=981085 RepID=W9SI46_9ROSA|nr:mitotic apparatus protein p62 [Morus notabilis]XP_024027905.1 mitotic apparatus protein p62 [Morus notabilis]XP_024027906.1 mitotic apparatus protein p62 [Morus notabilis]XP_024027907.1 mitotic apparatus protein p62 [Morus notabilis]XP_024027908.1 mitotic apparatus protein p62 [Morus notabilis]XP_024027909.1 mitotic apparatus protein p62 [Morus notabilis]EXC09159.1 hypothetical protein L484_005115 [Morus notabilis]